MTNDANSRTNREFIQEIKELTGERMKLREDAEAQSQHASEDSEKQEESDNLELKIVSFLIGSESHANAFAANWSVSIRLLN